MLHSLNLEVDLADSLNNLPVNSTEESYLAILINTTFQPLPDVNVIHELTRRFSIKGKHNLIGIRGRDSEQPNAAYSEAGVSNFLTLPTSIDQVQKLLFGE